MGRDCAQDRAADPDYEESNLGALRMEHGRLSTRRCANASRLTSMGLIAGGQRARHSTSARRKSSLRSMDVGTMDVGTMDAGMFNGIMISNVEL